jgi:hypothetical protein
MTTPAITFSPGEGDCFQRSVGTVIIWKCRFDPHDRKARPSTNRLHDAFRISDREDGIARGLAPK